MRRTLLWMAAGIVLTLFTAGSAGAGNQRAMIDDYARIEAVDPVARTVTLRGEMYVVGHEVEVIGLYGYPIELRELKVMERTFRGDMRPDTADAVHFEGQRIGRRLFISSMRVIEEIPH